MKNRIIVLCGPTASGKSAAGLELADRFGSSIICMDSMQIYKGMDIGTAKPSKEEQERCAHYMLDVVSPFENYSAAQYAADAFPLLDSLSLPVMIGGTGLYLNAVSTDMEFGFDRGDESVRTKYEQMAAEHGNGFVHSLLEQKDPAAAQKLHINDLRRVIRALEVFELTGKPFSSQRAGDMYRSNNRYDFHIFALSMDRERLYHRINIRVDEMMKNGLYEEVEGLRKEGVTADLQSMQGIGYKEILEVMDGRSSLDSAVDLIKQRSRNYAKRQLTWFRRDPRVNWLDMDQLNVSQALDVIREKADI
ncbi:MAG: tRNA (adenosine(37)-N6)-dimethylallyltransferase MiaA [Clostridiales bacterium]|nr:tRNA (adenosine(37)-N6)-dimethylallyltransferase MiaA [Clostridiales bacterium]